jgi:chromate transporter
MMKSPFLEVLSVFTRLGFTAFGGPAAHIGIFHQEVVERRGWVTDAEFLDLLGATNLIPGPNSTEMAIHLGYRRAGWKGLIAGGLGFTIPAMLIVLVLSYFYVRYSTTPQVEGLFYGIEPVVVAIILQALIQLGRTAIKSVWIALLGVTVFGLYFLGVNEVLLLLGGGLVYMLLRNGQRLATLRGDKLPLLALPLAKVVAGAVPFSMPVLFLTFFKIGAILYGSGYVLIAFLQADFVDRLGWITQQQLLDGIAIGQVTPGPLFTTATFIGYLLAGVPGGVVATLGIFLPSYIFVALSSPWIPKMRASPWLAPLLDGVIAASLGLMAAVSLQLGRGALVDPLTVALFGLALVVLLKFKVNSTWLIAGGALVGLVVYWL